MGRHLFTLTSRILEYCVALLVVCMTVVVIWQVVTRQLLRDVVPGGWSSWSQEASQILLVWISMLGASLAVRRGAHLGVDILLERWGAGFRLFSQWLAGLVVISFSGMVLVWGGWLYVTETLRSGQVASSLPIQMGYVYAAIPIAGLLNILFALEILCWGASNPIHVDRSAAAINRSPRRVRTEQIVLALAIGTALLIALTFANPQQADSETNFPLLVMVASFVILTLLGVPIAFGLGLATFSAWIALFCGFYEYTLAEAWTDALPYLYPSFFNGINKFPLLAIPFFIFCGLLMGAAGCARRLVDLANVFVGWIVGGLAYVNVLACMLFGAISGSATAATSAIGTFLIPTMEKEGYGKPYSTALTMCAATTGLVIPPSNVMIIYSVAVGGISVAAIFVAGYLPGIIMGLCLMMVAGVLAWRQGYTRSGWEDLGQSPGQIARTIAGRFLIALPDLLLIVIIMGGILAGYFTATEASAIGVVYSFLLWFLHSCRGGVAISLRAVGQILITTGITTAFIMFLICTSTAMGVFFTDQSIPQMVSSGLLALSANRIVVLLIINAILLFVGTFMDMTPAVLIFTPIFLPVAESLGIHPIHFGIILIVNLCIGLITPPVGTVLFVGCGVARLSISQVIRPLMPFLIALLIALLVITFAPSELVLWLPRIWGLLD